ncbi:pyrroline-5-carboxylate reductase [Solirubrobacter sp. CPCC 204708]|uniref:Pyrroline-5-carboxylate reductase n=1 Tax=Solirubrobacter deserti TaxID=2282478 RepID=A0ABT4RJQ8_9ACTN|nr:pyrroline-5-carboxylate reductase [Solirubrobacter deserti]MBE2315874.1 pyrroline-5-carboxylate reductase [Solirubrobacter deserti]MDA0138788.1 pyrroline-5-carboxylate reductase [Solirubrobacter deserti]
MSVPLLLVGGGRMGEALLGGMLAAGRPAQDFAVAEVSAARRAALTATYPGVQVVEQPVAAEGVVLATKPNDIAAVAAAAAQAGAQRLLSVAAGITAAAIEAAAPLPVIRAMPNTPALVGAGVTAIAPGAHAGEDDLAWAEAILGAVGVVVRVKEAQLDAVTGVSGSGPAYVFLIAEALSDAGVLAGLPRDLANTLAFQTLLGSAQLLIDGDSPANLRAAVTSPGGTTAAGLRELERGGVRSAFLEAVMAATERSRELGSR